MKRHCQSVHAIGTHIAWLKFCTSWRIGKGLFFPTPVAIINRAIPHFEFVAINIDKVDVTILKFCSTKRQAFDTQTYCLKVVTSVTQYFLTVLAGIFVKRSQDEGKKTTALFGLQSIVGRTARLLRNCHCLFIIVSENNRNWS